MTIKPRNTSLLISQDITVIRINSFAKILCQKFSCNNIFVHIKRAPCIRYIWYYQYKFFASFCARQKFFNNEVFVNYSNYISSSSLLSCGYEVIMSNVQVIYEVIKKNKTKKNSASLEALMGMVVSRSIEKLTLLSSEYIKSCLSLSLRKYHRFSTT